MISIVVATRNRAAYLPETLRSYEQVRSAHPWELIFVDNGSTDDTGGVLKRFAETAKFGIRLASEPRPGVSRARNTGWKLATGDLIVFTDDDCYPAADFIDAVAAVFEQPDLHFIGGRILLHDPGDYPITIQLSTERVDLPPRTFIASGLIQGANIAVRSRVLQQTGGFDELLGPGTLVPAGEDVDFLNRASAHGFRCAYDPRPVVSHHHRRRTEAQVNAVRRSYHIGRGGFFAKGVLDPLRRSEVSRQWYRRTLLSAFASREGLSKLRYELTGACRYLWSRLRAGKSRPSAK